MIYALKAQDSSFKPFAAMASKLFQEPYPTLLPILKNQVQDASLTRRVCWESCQRAPVDWETTRAATLCIKLWIEFLV